MEQNFLNSNTVNIGNGFSAQANNQLQCINK